MRSRVKFADTVKAKVKENLHLNRIKRPSLTRGLTQTNSTQRPILSKSESKDLVILVTALTPQRVLPPAFLTRLCRPGPPWGRRLSRFWLWLLSPDRRGCRPVGSWAEQSDGGQGRVTLPAFSGRLSRAWPWNSTVSDHSFVWRPSWAEQWLRQRDKCRGHVGKSGFAIFNWWIRVRPCLMCLNSLQERRVQRRWSASPSESKN